MPETVITVPVELLSPAECKHYEGSMPLPVFKAGPDLYSFANPLTWSVDLTNTGDAILIMGTAEGTATTGCARCLEPMEYDFLGEVEGYFLLEAGECPEDMEGDEFDILPEDRQIDLAPLITAALLVDAPYIPLCQDDCKGICPDCGINLNSDDCDCAEKREAKEAADAEAANPFAALKELTFDE